MTVADVIYDAATHTSRLGDGRVVPHVTAILSAVGVSTDFEALAEHNPKLRTSLEFAAARGTAVHADCHADDDGQLDWQTIDPRVRPYVWAWSLFRLNAKLVPLARERRIFHPVYCYTGILDGVFTNEERHSRILIDIKTGNPDHAAAHLQTAAYAEAWNFDHPDHPITDRWAVWLQPELQRQYTVVPYTNWEDFAVFQACLCVYNHQPERRTR